MRNFIKHFMVGLLIIFSISSCALNNSALDTNKISNEQLSLKIKELNNDILVLQEQVDSLITRINEPEKIQPIAYDDKLLYINSKIPLTISLPKDIDLPIVVYGYDESIVIFFENEDNIQFIEGYIKMPSIIVKENNDNPEYYDKKAVVKKVDENWVIVKNVSIENSLDEQTNIKIRSLLENIKFY